MIQTRTPRRASLAALTASAVLLAGALAPAPAAAQAGYPTKPITLIVPYAAGGFADTRARKLGEKLSKALGVAVVVDNRAGAGGVLGTSLVAKAAPDGYTLGMGNLAPLAVNVSLMKKLPYDPQKDITPIVLIEKAPLILTSSPSLPFATVNDIVAAARAKPGSLTYGSSGIGGAHHLSAAMFAHQAGIELVHVPYKGGSAAATDLLSGQISLMFEMGYAALPSIKADRLRAVAVTSTTRLAALPNVPTMAQAGLAGFESYNWQGIIGPRGLPPDVVARLVREFNDILKLPDVREMFTSTASEPAGGTPEVFAAFIRAETVKWGAVVRAANIQPE